MEEPHHAVLIHIQGQDLSAWLVANARRSLKIEMQILHSLFSILHFFKFCNVSWRKFASRTDLRTIVIEDEWYRNHNSCETAQECAGPLNTKVVEG